ncbi:carbohydrate sulfotransferase 5 [Aplysia californica]|uniref:Carbohydrate sulfotransferase 5 n=1 Tax=Aplysia californica TaxID=6500 RepID=A0ABM1VTG8_APLCA|nr:carbohydrate sulfotransferase 5 [Aplysia californica]
MINVLKRHLCRAWTNKRAHVIGAVLVCVFTQILCLIVFRSELFTTFERHKYSVEWHEESNDTASKELEDMPITPKRPMKILLLGYMRSGSTFCGDILQANPDVFYVYEPILYTWDHYMPGHTNPSVRRIKASFSKTRSYIPEPLEFLDYMYRCNLTAENVGFLTNVKNSHAFASEKCSGNSTLYNAIHEANVGPCSELVLKRCKAAKSILLKVVRLSMREADKFLEKDPELKVIHLVRDPRGTLLSRMHFTSKLTGEMHKNYTNICRRILDDIQVSKIISGKHFGRILTVRYEDLAQEPFVFFRKMYSFLGLKYTPSVEQYIQKRTSIEGLSAYGKPLIKSTFRKDPFKTAYQWRQELPFQLVKKIDHACKGVYLSMGYRTFSNEEDLRDMSISAKDATYGKGRMTLRLV